jgi:hypothetical protein
MNRAAQFMAGIAAAASVPAAVRAGADGNPLPFVLGGLFAVLPDLLDASVGAREPRRLDVFVYPDPLAFDPEGVAEGVARALERAAESGQPVGLVLGEVRLSANAWRESEVVFDPVEGCVRVCADSVAEFPLPCGVCLPDGIRIRVGASGDRVVRLTPRADGDVCVELRPAGMPWSHSLWVGLAAAGVVTGLWGVWMGLLVGGAWGVHLLADIIGGAGPCIWHPLSRWRPSVRPPERPGVSGAVVWGAFLWVLVCLARTVPGVSLPNPMQCAFFGFVVPLAAWRLARRLMRPAFSS